MGPTLRSWKEIARHMGASVRTVQRWEREFRLPVRRIEARRGAVVFAFPAELENWLRSRSQSQAPFVEDSYFRTVFMDSQFPSMVVDQELRILAANFAALRLLGRRQEQLLGEKLPLLMAMGKSGRGGAWAATLQGASSFGQANLLGSHGRMLGIEFVIKRFRPGLRVVSILALHRPWLAKQVWCRPVKTNFAFRVQPGRNPSTE
jgi:PAS domain-containing protein